MRKSMVLLLLGLGLIAPLRSQENNNLPESENEGWSYFELVDSLENNLPEGEFGLEDPSEGDLPIGESESDSAGESEIEEELDEELQAFEFEELPEENQEESSDADAEGEAETEEEFIFGSGDTIDPVFPTLALPGGGEGIGESNSEEAIRDQKIIDGAYEKITVLEREALAHQTIRDADVHWSKRLWREIDCRQKLNRHFIWKKEPFIEILLNIAETNQTPIFADEDFESQIGFADVHRRLNTVDTVEVLNPDTYEYELTIVNNDPNFDSFTTFRIKEDWIFDTRDSRMKPRILGIAPVREIWDDDDNYRGSEVLFWVHYESIRDYLVKYEAFNPANDGFRMSWTDVFDMRYFDSMITKENNSHDLRIKDVYEGRDALLEAKKIQEKVFNWEQDLWSY